MIRVGILGSGFGQEHARLLKSHDHVEIAGIFGRNKERLHAIEKELGILGVTEGDELIQDPSIDVIDVCLPTKLHHEYVLKALRQKKHVFCEIPVSYSLQEAEEMMAEAKRVGCHLLVNQFSRFFPDYRNIRRFIHAGNAGKILSSSQYVRASLGPEESLDLGLGTISVNLMTIEFDITTWLFGLPDHVSAFGTELVPPKRASVHAFLTYPDTDVVVHASSLMPDSYPFTRGIILTGEKGTIEFTFRIQGDQLEHTCIFYPAKGVSQELSVTHCYPFHAAINHMVDVISGKEEQSPLTIDQAIESLKIALAVNQSLEQGGKTVAL